MIEVVNDWGSGRQANISVTAECWELSWAWPAGQAVESFWNVDPASSGSSVTATDVGWNGLVASGATVEAFGFIGSGASAAPAVTCSGAAGAIRRCPCGRRICPIEDTERSGACAPSPIPPQYSKW